MVEVYFGYVHIYMYIKRYGKTKPKLIIMIILKIDVVVIE